MLTTRSAYCRAEDAILQWLAAQSGWAHLASLDAVVKPFASPFDLHAFRRKVTDRLLAKGRIEVMVRTRPLGRFEAGTWVRLCPAEKGGAA